MDKTSNERIEEAVYEIMIENRSDSERSFGMWFATTIAAKVAVRRYQRALGLFTPETVRQAKYLCKWAWYAREHECALKDLRARVQHERIVELEEENKKLRWTIENVLDTEQESSLT